LFGRDALVADYNKRLGGGGHCIEVRRRHVAINCAENHEPWVGR
jgi:hypothetical protein